MPGTRNQERGSALLQAMLAITAVSAAILTVVPMQNNYIKEREVQKERAQRTELANKLLNHISNPAFIAASTNLTGIKNKGNDHLFDCVAFDKQTQTLVTNPLDTSGKPKCDPKSAYKNGKGLEFLLQPAPGHIYRVDKGAGNDSNCPNPNKPDHISCFLAGKDDKKKVGYNLEGDTGELSDDFPFEAKAYFIPVCSSTPLSVDDVINNPSKNNSKCHVAQDVLVRMELAHQVFAGKKDPKLGRFGVYPNEPRWARLSVLEINGHKCNEGGVVITNKEGKIKCECQLPYKDTGTINARGPICELRKLLCPGGLVLAGRDISGEPICRRMDDTDKWKITIGQADQNSSQGGLVADCSTAPDGTKRGGWISKIKQRCNSQWAIEKVETPQFDWEVLLIGAGAGMLAFFFLSLAQYVYFTLTAQPFGIAYAQAALLSTGFMTIGAILAYPFAWGKQESLVPKDRFRPVPEVYCEFEVDCRAFKLPKS